MGSLSAKNASEKFSCLGTFKDELPIFGSKVPVQLFSKQITEQAEGGEGREERGATPLDLLCWLTVIWPGAPTDSMGEVPTATSVHFYKIRHHP